LFFDGIGVAMEPIGSYRNGEAGRSVGIVETSELELKVMNNER
jgi:hypothetical protein